MIEPDGKGYHGFVPLLPGVHTYGKNFKETRNRLDEAVKCHLQGLLKDREAIPQESEALEIVTTISDRELGMASRYA